MRRKVREPKRPCTGSPQRHNDVDGQLGRTRQGGARSSNVTGERDFDVVRMDFRDQGKSAARTEQQVRPGGSQAQYGRAQRCRPGLWTDGAAEATIGDVDDGRLWSASKGSALKRSSAVKAKIVPIAPSLKQSVAGAAPVPGVPSLLNLTALEAEQLLQWKWAALRLKKSHGGSEEDYLLTMLQKWIARRRIESQEQQFWVQRLNDVVQIDEIPRIVVRNISDLF